MTGVREWAELFLATTLAGLLLVFFLFRRPRKQNLPPGPRGWPLLGSLLSLGTLPHRALAKLSEQYGPLMFMHLGSVRTLVVSSPDLAEKILKTHDQIMCSRPDQTIAVNHIVYGGIDIAFSPYCKRWRYQRQVCTERLFASSSISQFREIREREVLATLQFILEESKQGNDVNVAECFSTLTLNNMTQMLARKSYCARNSGSKSSVSTNSTSFREDLQELFVVLGAFNLSDYVPVLEPFDLQGLEKRSKNLHKRFDKFLDDIIDEHRHSPSNGAAAEDFVDVLLGVGKSKEFQEQLSIDNIKAIMLDLIAAGTDTSSSSSHWALTELMRHPQVMRRVQSELDSVVGPHRLVQEEDVPKLKYLHAVVNESMRLHPGVPFLLPHQSMQDCEMQGFHVPAGTRVLVNVFAIQTDPTVWERPLEFDPDRFLNSTVDHKGQDFQFLPFGAGRRMCPGMKLGMLMVLYPLALLIHALDFNLSEGQAPTDVDTSELFGIVLYKKLPLQVVAKARLPNHGIYPAEQF